ncbi:MAG: glycoside-pentoside-hexuronide (GPH):cation symporter [Clostridia bacterium]|nr:glycoside-pentoside-hexuronide (GPH):cation symporter [Clostridia bacterium]
MRITEKIRGALSNFKSTSSFTLKEQLGFASGLFGEDMMIDMVGTFMLVFLTDYVGIELAALSIITLLTNALGLINDPIAGVVVEKTHSKLGRARPYLLFAPFPLAISSILLFVIPDLSYNGRLVYVFIFYFIYAMGYTFYDLSVMSVAARINLSPKDRKKFFSMGELAATLGSMLPGFILPILISMVKNDASITNQFKAQTNVYFICAVVFSVVATVMMIIPFFTLKEKNLDLSSIREKVKIKPSAILKNKPLMLAFVTNIIESFRQASIGLLAYFYLHTLNNFALGSIFSIFSGILAYIGIALVPWFGKRFSTKALLIGGYLYMVFWFIIFLIVGYNNLIFVGAILAIAGAPSGLLRAARRFYVVDSIDYMEWKTGERSEGMVMALNSLSWKMRKALKEPLLTLGLVIIGYQIATNGREAVQTEAVKKGIFYLMIFTTLIGSLGSVILFMFDDFTGKKKERILAELKARKESLLPITDTEGEKPI